MSLPNMTLDASGIGNSSTAAPQVEFDIHSYIGKLLFKIIPPFIIFPGTIGNILSILILRRPEIRNMATTPYLIALAVADLLALNLPLLRVWLKFAADFDIRAIHNAGCKLNIYGSYIVMFSSAWLQAAVNIDRLLYITSPLKWHRIRLKHRLIVIASVFVFFTAIDVHIPIYFKLVWNDEGHFIGCNINNTSYIYFIKYIWSWLDFLILFFLPFIIMFICSVGMIRNLLKTGQQVGNISYGSPRDVSRKTMKLLIGLNVVFFISTSPKRIFSIVEPFIPKWYEGAEVGYIYVISYLLMYLNHAVNFALYVMQGPKYREALRALFRQREKKDDADSVTLNTVTNEA